MSRPRAADAATAEQEKEYRPGVGIILLNSARLVWVGQRFGATSDAWQMPQGGIDAGESAEAAALRELAEETGVTPRLVEIIAASSGWHQYDLPPELTKRAWGGRYRGQRQKWYVMRFLGSDSDVDIATEDAEFSEWRWCEAAELVDNIIDFKRPLYAALVREFAVFFNKAEK
jgi:putative (di)nucleoside polyphosphate hydrolase